MRVVLLSVTEGEHKPRKYPTIFAGADLVVITKMDLAAAFGYDDDLARQALVDTHPGVGALRVSVKSGFGLGEWLNKLEAALAEKRGQSPVACCDRWSVSSGS